MKFNQGHAAHGLKDDPGEHFCRLNLFQTAVIQGTIFSKIYDFYRSRRNNILCIIKYY